MITRPLYDAHPRRWALVFETGDEVVETLGDFAHEHELAACHFAAIGAFRRVTLGFYDLERQEYLENPLEEQLEVASLVGNITRSPDGGWRVHAHVVVGRRNGEARAGHLLAGVVHPTLELFLTEGDSELRRRHHERTGLDLIR